MSFLIKNKFFRLGLIILTLVFGSQLNSFGSEVKRGDRPPVLLENLKPDAYHPGRIRVKFSEEAEKQLDLSVRKSSSGALSKTGISALDEIAGRYLFTGMTPLMDMVYQASDASHRYRDRHRQWGFHLWYDIEYAAKADVLEVVEALSGMEGIQIAEPLFRIRQVLPIEFELFDVENAIPETDKNTWIPNDPLYPNNQWHFNNTGQVIGGQAGTSGIDIRMQAAWHIHKGSPSVIGAVMDDGIQFNHPDLAQNMWPGIGYNFVGNTDTIHPGDHGTHVAGTIAAVSNNSRGVAGIAGGSGSGNGVRLMSCQVFNSAGSGGIPQAMIYAADNGAAISQNSWGYEEVGVYNQAELDAIDYFNAHGGGNILLGGITIFAAGNDNDGGLWYPAAYMGAMAVASTNNRDVRSGFSNFGDWVDVSAPGSGVASTVTESAYAFMSGTSMACPHVSGVAALMISLAPGILSASQVKDILVQTTDNHYAQNPDFIGKLGSGRLNAFSALEVVSHMLGDVAPPTSFQATATGADRIELSWLPNPDNNPVMIAWSTTNAFGNPQDGIAYQQGSVLPGGGSVLYRGNAVAFIHTGLNSSTTYYYRIWSVTAQNNYSLGITSQATTQCDAVSVPISQDFSSGQMPPSCWTLIDADGDGRNWRLASTASGHSPHTGAFAAVSASYDNTSGPLRPDNWLITPPITSQTGVVELSYFVKAQDPSWPREKYSILVSVAGNNPQSFTPVFTERLTDGAWQERNVEISGLAGAQAYIAFRHWDTTDEYELLLDNIRITEKTGPVMHTITAIAGPGGSISPSGVITIAQGGSQTFTITPQTGYEISQVLINGNNVGTPSSYTFTNVTSNQSISVSFSALGYTITATAGFGGTISPSGAVSVAHGGSQTFTITPQSGYEIDQVQVNGTNVGTPNSYTFTNVTSNQSISVSFSALGYTITATAGFGGTISPSGAVSVAHGGSQTFTITPQSGYEIAGVLADGNQVGKLTSYTFSNVVSNHSIQAQFEPIETFAVEFRVDMQFWQGFNPATDKVYLTGSMFEWASPGSIPGLQNLSAGKSAMIFSRVLQLPAGVYEYKYYLNDGFSGDEMPGRPNRSITVSGNTQTADFFGYLNDPTFLGEVSDNESFVVYPNPSRGVVTLVFNQAIHRIVILDYSGKEVYSFLPHAEQYTLNLGFLPPGLYFLKAQTGLGSVSRKLLLY